MKNLPWKWIVGIGVIAFLLFRVGLVFAGLLDDANDARDVTRRLQTEIVELERDTVRFSRARDSTVAAHAVLAAADSVELAGLASDNAALEGTIRDLSAQDAVNEESVDEALRDLGAVLNPEAVPALRAYTAAWQTRLVGVQATFAALDSINANLRTEIVVVEGQRDRSIERESAADVLLAGLRPLIVQKDSIIASQSIEIGALRALVAPSFIKRILQMPEVVLVGAVIGAGTTLLVLAR